jgi:hypothetical protein
MSRWKCLSRPAGSRKNPHSKPGPVGHSLEYCPLTVFILKRLTQQRGLDARDRQGVDGNFSGGPSVLLERGCYEGVLHKPSDASLAFNSRAYGRNRLSCGTNRNPGGSSCGGARSRTSLAEHDLKSLRNSGACRRVSRNAVDSCIPVPNPVKCGAERHS